MPMGLASTWRTEVVHLERWEEARTARIRGRLDPGWADPKPFARVAIFYGQPFPVGAGRQAFRGERLL